MGQLGKPLTGEERQLIAELLLRASLRELFDLIRLAYRLVGHRLDREPTPPPMNEPPPANYWSKDVLRGIMGE